MKPYFEVIWQIFLRVIRACSYLVDAIFYIFKLFEWNEKTWKNTYIVKNYNIFVYYCYILYEQMKNYDKNQRRFVLNF